jgi:hypothetical protein
MCHQKIPTTSAAEWSGAAFLRRIRTMKIKWMLERDPVQANAYLLAIGAIQALPHERQAEFGLLDVAESLAVRLLQDNDDDMLAAAVVQTERVAGLSIDLVRAIDGGDEIPVELDSTIAPFDFYVRRRRAWASKAAAAEAALAA